MKALNEPSMTGLTNHINQISKISSIHKLTNVKLSFLLVLLLCSCIQNEPHNTQQNTINEATTQAILKTQLVPFNIEEKSEIRSKYEAQSMITVPSDLAPQNKWVMFEGPVLENELIAYRFYLDSRHRSDIYGKKTNALVMDTVGWDYHEIMDWGSDVLKVGQSLGIGSPAIWYADSLYTLSDCTEKTVAIIDAGGPIASIKFAFKALKIGQKPLNITQLWSIMPNHPHAKVTLEVENGELPEDAHFATGIVKHLPEAESGTDEDNFFLFTWGKQSFHKQNLGMGILANSNFSPVLKNHLLNHLIVFENSKTGVEYEFAAAWEADVMKVTTAKDFKKILLK